MLFPPPKTDRAPRREPSPGLSKPRFVKVRRHFASPRVRPGPATPADSEEVAHTGFNPFRSGPPPAGDASGAGISDRSSSSIFGNAQAEGTGFVFDGGLNPDRGGSAAAFAKDTDGGLAFTFGGNGNTGGLGPAKAQNAAFVFAAGSSDPSHFKSTASEDGGNAGLRSSTAGNWSSVPGDTVPRAGAFDFGTGTNSSWFHEWDAAPLSENSKEEGIPPSSDVFLFGSGSKKRVVSDRSSADGSDKSAIGKLPEEMQKLHVKGSGNAGNAEKSKAGDHSFRAGDGGTFVFGINKNKNVSSSSSESNSAPGVFVFGNRLNKCTIPDGGSTDFSGKGTVDKLREEIQKMNVKDSTMRNWSADIEDASHKFTAAGSCNSSAETTIPNAGVFGFGITAKHHNFDESMSCIPNEMKKLNIKVPSGIDGLGKMKEPDYSSEVDRTKIFIIGSNHDIGSSCEHPTGKLPEELKTSNTVRAGTNITESEKEESMTSSTGVFVFGSSSKMSAIPRQGVDDGFDKSATGKLREVMQKMKISGSGDDGSVGKSRGGNDGLDSGSFAFGSRKSVSGSFGEGNSATGVFGFGFSSKKSNDPDLSAFDDSDKSSMGNSSGTHASESSKNVSGFFGESKCSAGCFVFGSNSTQGTDLHRRTANSFDHGRIEKLPDDMQKLNIRGSQNCSHFEKAEAVDYNTGNSAFVFGSKKDSSASSGETNSTSGFFVFGSSSNRSTVFNDATAGWFHKGNKLQDEMQKLNIRGSMDNDPRQKDKGDSCSPIAGDSGMHNGNTFTSMSTSQQFSFHATNQDGNAGVGGVPPPSADFYVRPMAERKTSSCSSSFGSVSQSSGCDSTFTGHFGTPHTNFASTGLDSSWHSKGNFVQYQNVAFNIKNGTFSHSRSKKKRGKLRDPATHSERGGKGFTLRAKVPQVNSEHDPTGDYSPMDFSPCQMESSVVEKCSREASVASGESIDVSSHPSSSDIANSVPECPNDEDLEHAAECLDANEEYLQHGVHDGVMKPCAKAGFSFAATPAPVSTSASKRNHRRKFKTKVRRDPYASNPDVDVHFPSTAQLFSISSHLDSAKAQTGVPSVSATLQDKTSETNKMPDARQESISMAASSIAAQEACEKWRLRGNQAYANGDLSKAEEYYTHGMNSISSNESSRSCARALMLCYSNRAATRMSIGRIREALCDCVMATAIDPGFLRAQLRAANCYLLLGEIEDACSHFKKCLLKGSESCMDRKFVLEASDGLQKAQQAADYVAHATALLRRRTTSDTTSAIQTISDALSLCSYSDSLVEMKAEALLMLRRYDELIQLCDQTLASAELNSSLSSASDQLREGDNFSGMQSSSARAWRCYLKSRAYFCLGRLEEALSLLQEQEPAEGTAERCGSKSDALTLLSATVHELLRLKIAGNTAFKAGRHSEAVEHYTAALAYNIESRPFAAVCFCNRAAAYQALGQATDAISDCSFAIALDPSYPKAISRRATLCEMIRDYSQASNDLQRLISVLEGKFEDKSSGKRATINGEDLELVRLRLAKVEEKARKEIPLDMYMILGIETSSDSAEIKKAYRKAALRHHPDKAGQFLVRSDNANEGLWKEVADEVHRDADHLFKIIGEAYAVLSDPTKRLQYDSEEEIRTSQKGNSGSSTPRTQPDLNSSHFEKSSGRWQSRDNWRSYGSSSQRCSGSYRSSRNF